MDDEWSKEEMERIELTLSSKPDGSPDWKYMQKYMKILKQSTPNIIDMIGEV